MRFEFRYFQLGLGKIYLTCLRLLKVCTVSILDVEKQASIALGGNSMARLKIGSRIAVVSMMSFFGSLGFQSFAVAADTVSCISKGAVRCMCPASMIVQCADGRQGFIGNAESVSSVVVTYRSESGVQKTITLNNPAGKARDFYAAKYNEEVKAALQKAGVTFNENDQVDLKSITVSKSAKLYDDPKMEKEVSKNDAQPTSDEMPSSCNYQGYQRIVGIPETKFQKTCVSWTSCSYKDGKNVVGALACSAPTGACPQDALDCASDEKTPAIEPEVLEKLVCSKKDGTSIPGCKMAGTPARLSGSPQDTTSESSTNTGLAR